MSDVLISRYEVTIEYVGAPQERLKPKQRFIAKMVFGIDSTAIAIHIPLPQEEKVFRYPNLSACEKDWVIIERHI